MNTQSTPKTDAPSKTVSPSLESETIVETSESESGLSQIARKPKKEVNLTPAQILQLQRSHGNQYVMRLIEKQKQATTPERAGTVQRAAVQEEEVAPISVTTTTPQQEATAISEPTIAPQEEFSNQPPETELNPQPQMTAGRERTMTSTTAATTVQRTLSQPEGGTIQRSFFGKLKSILTHIGIALGKTVLGPFYELIQYAIYLRSGKAGTGTRNIDLHPFKDYKKWKGSSKRVGESASAAARYGVGQTVGQIPLFLRMVSSGFLKKIISWASWLALWTGLLGMIPGAQALLAVTAAVSSVALIMQLAKTAIDMVLNTWSGVSAWVLYMNLPLTGLKLGDQNVKDYLEAYKEYKKTRGETVDNALKLATGAILGGASSDLAGKSFSEGATKAFTNVNPSGAFDTTMSNMGTQSGLDKVVHANELKYASKEVIGGVTKEASGNFGSWMGKGRLTNRKDKDYKNVGTESFKTSPNLQMLVSNNLIGNVEEGKIRKGEEKDFGGTRGELVGPPGESLKGMLGSLVNPLGGIIFLFFSIAKAIQKAKAAKNAVKNISTKASKRVSKTEKHGKQPKVEDPILSEEQIISNQGGGSISSSSTEETSPVQNTPPVTPRSRSNSIRNSSGSLSSSSNNVQTGNNDTQPQVDNSNPVTNTNQQQQDSGGKTVTSSEAEEVKDTAIEVVNNESDSVEETANDIAESTEIIKEDFETNIKESELISSGSKDK